MSARRADLLCVALLIGLSTVLFADVLFLGSNFAFRDLFIYHFPMKRVVHDLIARGELPWWNPSIAGGQPMAANPAYEIFYPPQYLIFAGSYEFGFALHIVFHIWLALAGMFLFLRALPLGRPAAVFGAISFGLGGFFLGCANTLPAFFVWSWAGFAGWAVLRWLRGGSFAVAAIVMAMPMLVGEPVTLALLWILIVVAAWREWKRIALLAAAATAIAAVQMIPMLDHLRDSARSRGISYENVVAYSMPPVRPLELIAPNAFSAIDAEHPRFDLRVFWPVGRPYFLSLYCGLAAVVLAIAGLAMRVRGAGRAAAIVAVSYVVAIGGHTPLFRLLYAAGLRSIRFPEKFIAAGIVTLIVFAAIVADRLLAAPSPSEGRSLQDGAPHPPLRGTFSPRGGEKGLQRVAAIASIVIAIITSILGWWTMTLLAAGWALLLWLYRDTRIWRLAALALLLIDVGSFSQQAIPRMPRAYFTPPAVATALDRDSTVFHRGEWKTTPAVAALDLDSTTWLARNALRPFTAVSWGFRSVLEADIDQTNLLPTHDLADSMWRLANSGFPHWSEPYILMSNVRYVIDYRDAPSLDDPIRVTRVPNQGRFWFASQLSRNQVRRGCALVREPFVPAAARITGIHETASSATIDVDAAGTAFLVITITRHKYWRAAIDGRDAPLVAANIAYQGLVVPAGRHRIELRYRNPLIGWSAGASALALAVVVLGSRRWGARP